MTIRPLAPRKLAEGEAAPGAAASEVALPAHGISLLRLSIAILALATALLALVAIWWQSVGARGWDRHRRKAQPRLMIDIPLAVEPRLSEPALREVALDPANA